MCGTLHSYAGKEENSCWKLTLHSPPIFGHFTRLLLLALFQRLWVFWYVMLCCHVRFLTFWKTVVPSHSRAKCVMPSLLWTSVWQFYLHIQKCFACLCHSKWSAMMSAYWTKHAVLLINHYNLFKVLACSTTFFHLSLFCATFFQLRTFMLFISSKTSSSQRILGLPIDGVWIDSCRVIYN